MAVSLPATPIKTAQFSRWRQEKARRKTRVEDMTATNLAGPAEVLPALARVLSLESRIMER